MYIVACFVDDIDSDVFMIFLLSLFLQFEMRYSNSLFSLAFPFKINEEARFLIKISINTNLGILDNI